MAEIGKSCIELSRGKFCWKDKMKQVKELIVPCKKVIFSFVVNLGSGKRGKNYK